VNDAAKDCYKSYYFKEKPMYQEIDAANAKKLLKGISIPIQPQVLVDIQLETLMPNFELADISKIIAKDVGLSGSILKVVNSPFFGLKSQITSIQQAIGLLGVDSVINIIQSVEIKNALSDDSIVALTSFWDNALDVAKACAAVSKHISFSSPDDAYTLGLFHNCGIPLMMQRYEGYLDTVKLAYQQSEKRITDIENEAFSSNHAVIGFYVAKSWKLPEVICLAIADHHKVDSIFETSDTESKEKTLLAILSIASHLCESHKHIGEAEDDFEFKKIQDAILSYTGLTSIDLDDIKDDLIEIGILN